MGRICLVSLDLSLAFVFHLFWVQEKYCLSIPLRNEKLLELHPFSKGPLLPCLSRLFALDLHWVNQEVFPETVVLERVFRTLLRKRGFPDPELIFPKPINRLFTTG